MDLDVLKVFNMVWNKCLIPKLPLFCKLTSNFLTSLTITVDADGMISFSLCNWWWVSSLFGFIYTVFFLCILLSFVLMVPLCFLFLPLHAKSPYLLVLSITLFQLLPKIRTRTISPRGEEIWLNPLFPGPRIVLISVSKIYFERCILWILRCSTSRLS